MTTQRPDHRKLRWLCRARETAKGLLLVAVGLLACAALLRTLVALVEAAALLTLALVTASLALPRGPLWYWRQARREIPRWLRQAALLWEARPAPPADRPQP